MGRARRVEFAGAVFHITARRVERRRLFVDEADYRRYVDLLELVIADYDWNVVAFCLMPNHIHLLVQIAQPNLAKGMHRLHRNYVRAFNDRHGRSGRLFEHRYHPKLVGDEIYYLTAIRYIDENPVNAALCDSADAWPWSSRGITRTGKCPPRLRATITARELKDATWNRL